MKRILILVIFQLSAVASIMACHDVTVTELSAIDNGDGTYTYDLEICVGNLEDTWGFELSLNWSGAVGTIVNFTPSITSGNTGNTINASVPSSSGGGDIEYGDFDNTASTLYSNGAGNECNTISLTVTEPISSVDLFGAQWIWGPCSGSGTTTGCFTPSYTVEITTDDYGFETSWEIVDQGSGAVVASGNSYANNTSYSIPVCIPNGCYDFIIYDSFGDGICCTYGSGSYQVLDFSGVPVASGASFAFSETTDISCVALPVELISFEGSAKDDNALLKWTTESESNNDYFTIERSLDGVTWRNVGTVKGMGNTSEINSYEFTDKLLNPGLYYYRLSQTDHDGTTSQIGVVTVNIHSGNIAELYPNPTNNILNIVISSKQAENASVIVYSANGQKVYAESLRLSRGLSKHSVSMEELPAGYYFVKIIGESHTSTSRIIKY